MNRSGQCESLNFPFWSLLLSFACSCHCGPWLLGVELFVCLLGGWLYFGRNQSQFIGQTKTYSRCICSVLFSWFSQWLASKCEWPPLSFLPVSFCIILVFPSAFFLFALQSWFWFYFLFVFNAIFILCDVAVVSEDLTWRDRTSWRCFWWSRMTCAVFLSSTWPSLALSLCVLPFFFHFFLMFAVLSLNFHIFLLLCGVSTNHTSLIMLLLCFDMHSFFFTSLLLSFVWTSFTCCLFLLVWFAFLEILPLQVLFVCC